MKNQFDRIEARLTSMIEGSLSTILPLGNRPGDLAHELAAAIHANQSTGEDGTIYAPNVYTIQVHPGGLLYWQTDPRILERVANELYQTARDEGLQFHNEPVLRLAANPDLSPQHVHVLASYTDEPMADTAALKNPTVDPEKPVESTPPNAFLIVNGVDTFPLRGPVTNIGRRLDNHLSIDDPRVSRRHAQLRVIRGQFILFDLNSTGGTYVNGQRISQINLNPGDVISLAGVALIFGQDTPPSSKSAVSKTLPPGSTQSFLNPYKESTDKKRQR